MTNDIFECYECQEDKSSNEIFGFFYHPINGDSSLCKKCHHVLDGPSDDYYENFHEKSHDWMAFQEKNSYA